jgi:hypothetical protein
MAEPLISVVILNYNGARVLPACLESVMNSAYGNFEVVLVDNASSDQSFEQARLRYGRDPRFVTVVNPQNLFFAEGNNRGIAASKGEYLVILNNDTEVHPDWLRHIACAMQADSSIGAAAPVIMTDVDRTRIEYAGADIDRFGFAFGRHCGKKIDAVGAGIEEHSTQAVQQWCLGAALLIASALLTRGLAHIGKTWTCPGGSVLRDSRSCAFLRRLFSIKGRKVCAAF